MCIHFGWLFHIPHQGSMFNNKAVPRDFKSPSSSHSCLKITRGVDKRRPDHFDFCYLRRFSSWWQLNINKICMVEKFIPICNYNPVISLQKNLHKFPVSKPTKIITESYWKWWGRMNSGSAAFSSKIAKTPNKITPWEFFCTNCSATSFPQTQFWDAKDRIF